MQLCGRRFDTGGLVGVEIEGSRIAAVRPLSERCVRGPVPWIAPALIDIQMNGYGGQEFSSAKLTVEAVATIVEAMNPFGVGQVFPTLTTESFDVLAHAMRTIARACAESQQLADRVPGIHLEGPFISPADGPRGAHPSAHCRPPDWDEFQRLQDCAGGRIRLLTLSPEYDTAPPFIARAAASGVIVAIGHTQATGEQIARAVDAGARMSTHLGNGSHPIIQRHPNYIWSQLADDRLAASLIVDGHHLPPEVVKSFVRAKTPQRCILVSDLSGLAGLPPGRYGSNLCELEILEDGRLVVAGQRKILAGASLPLSVGVGNVMTFAGVDLETAINMATACPAELFGLDTGVLEPGRRADLVIFDLLEATAAKAEQFIAKELMVAGRIVPVE